MTRKSKNPPPATGKIKKTTKISKKTKKTKKTTKKGRKVEKEKKTAFGKRQSPINIVSRTLKIDSTLAKNGGLKIDPINASFFLSIQARGWQADVAEGCTAVSLTASHLIGEYQLRQFHAHWSTDGNFGSEHTVDGKSFAAELHFVFWATKYSTFEEAAQKSDGLAVVGVFIEEIEKNRSIFGDSVEEALENGKPIDFRLDLGKLLPRDRTKFCTYPGSLTTCPYHESVTWNLFRETIKMGKEELDVWRRIFPSNHRESQKLNGRKVVASQKF